MKRLVLIYSLDGNTLSAGEKIAEAIDAELCRIETFKPLPKSNALKIMTGGMYVTLGICPKLKPLEVNLNDYDDIIIGTPVWAYKAAAPMWDVIKKHDIAHKVRSVFTYSGSGDNESCIKQLSERLTSLENTVSLVDRTCSGHESNDQRLAEFIEKIR